MTAPLDSALGGSPTETPPMATSVGEDFPRMQEHVREVLREYESIGPAGVFGATMIREVLRQADAAMASGDVVAMLHAYALMQEVN